MRRLLFPTPVLLRASHFPPPAHRFLPAGQDVGGWTLDTDRAARLGLHGSFSAVRGTRFAITRARIRAALMSGKKKSRDDWGNTIPFQCRRRCIRFVLACRKDNKILDAFPENQLMAYGDWKWK